MEHEYKIWVALSDSAFIKYVLKNQVIPGLQEKTIISEKVRDWRIVIIFIVIKSFNNSLIPGSG